MAKKPRILIGLLEAAGNCIGLTRGLRKMGYACDLIDRYPHPFKYAGEQHWATRLLQYLYRRSTSRGRFRRAWHITLLLTRGLLAFWALFKYDIFIFYYHTTFSDKLWDLPLFKFFGKKLIFVFVGSDSRPPYMNGVFKADPDSDKDVAWLIRFTAEQKKRLLKIEKYADYIINWIPHSLFHERRFILGTIIGVSVAQELPELHPSEADAERPVKILHAPSTPHAKGTPAIREMMANLRQKNYNFEYVEISGRPNQEVLEALADCDFVIDQIYSDTPLAGFATEAAIYGKPAVVGGYYCAAIHHDVPPEAIPPSLYVPPEEVEDAVARLITDRPFRLALGARARAFVENYLSSEMVAARFARIFNDDVPEAWWRDPFAIRYVHGDSQPEESLKKRLRAVLKHGGQGALQLDDKPALLAAVVELAAEADRARP